MNTTEAQTPILVWPGQMTETRIGLAPEAASVDAMARFGGADAALAFDVPLDPGVAQELIAEATRLLSPTSSGAYGLGQSPRDDTDAQALEDQVARTAHVPYAQAQVLWQLAQALAPGAGDEDALRVLDTGIEALSARYLHDGLIDDTHMKLMLADRDQSEGKLATARALKSGILDSRLQAYRAKHGFPSQ